MKFFPAYVCLLALLIAGCEKGGGSAVSGKVSAGGEKVTAGTLTFSPVGGGQPPVTATIKDDGTYTVNGAATGKNRIGFAVSSSADPVVLKPGESVKPPAFVGYTAQTPEVELKSGSNTVDVDLVAPK